MDCIFLEIEGVLPTQNEVLNLTKGNSRWSRRRYTEIKRGWEERIGGDVLEQEVKPLEDGRHDFVFHWFCKNRRVDPDNVAWASKIIFDALVRCGIMENDGWSVVASIQHNFSVDKDRPRVVVEISRRR